jgi:nitroreductase
MEFQEVVRKRRMVRHFFKRTVSNDIIDKILQIAQKAPSAGFSQGSAFIVIRNKEMKSKLAALQDEMVYHRAGFHKWISEAPIALVACVSEKVYHDRYREPDKLREDGTEIEWPTPYWFFDIGATCMLVFLAAVDFGLAAGFTGVSRVSEVKRLLKIPEHFHPVGVISIGYPNKDVKSPSLKRGRKPWTDFVHYERW